MKTFEVPEFYRSPLIASIKAKRKELDKLKKDFSPTELDFGTVKIYLARHFGFCYGVENAIEIAFKTVQENAGKNIYLLSEMIHNPQVNADLQKSGVQFIMDTKGKIITPWEKITSEDVVIIPAFGTTLATEALLRSKGIDPVKYNTTCPFVERVWNKAAQIAKQEYTVVLHGKPSHEETKATFSHSSSNAATVIIYNMDEAVLLAKYINQALPSEQFYKDFANRYSEGFDVAIHLKKIGVVNQTTMLAEDTQVIADYLKQIILAKNANEDAGFSFADTRDTLCYATNDNQTAIKGMLQQEADFAIIVGGYNSSNTSHLVELCEQKLPTYFIESENNINTDGSIEYFNFNKGVLESGRLIFNKNHVPNILLSSGASCPDAVIEKVLIKVLSLFPQAHSMNEMLKKWEVA